MSSTKYDVEKFCGKGNFSLWQRRMKDLLIQQGVHKALLGKEKKLETMKDVEWVEMDEKAASAIRLNLGDEVIHNILVAKTSKEVWEKLEGLYMGKDLANKLYVKKQLYSLHMREGSDLLEHPNMFNMLNTQLSSFGVNYEDEDKALLEEGTSALLSHIKMKQNSDGSQADGLIVKSESSNRGRSRLRGRNSNRNRSQSKSRAKKDVEYFYCHKKRH